MELTPKELMKQYVDSQNFTSTTQIMQAMKELFRDAIQQVMESELDVELGYEKSERMSDSENDNLSRNYRNGYSKKTVKTQLGEIEVKVPRDRNGEYEPKIIGKYSRNADGMEEKILSRARLGQISRGDSRDKKRSLRNRRIPRRGIRRRKHGRHHDESEYRRDIRHDVKL